MKKIIFLITLIIPLSSHSQQTSIVSGRISNIEFSKIALQSFGCPLTGASDEFEGIRLDSGNYVIQAELYTPELFKLVIDDYPALRVLLCPGENLTINYDSVEFKFETEGMTAEYFTYQKEIDNLYNFEFFGEIIESGDYEKLQPMFSELEEKNLARLDTLNSKFSISPCENEILENRIRYSIYTWLWSDLMQKGIPIDNDVYQFLSSLPLDDTEAAKVSLDYNRALDVYVFLKLRLEQGWIEPASFDPSSDSFNEKIYNKIIEEIDNIGIRDVMLMRKVINLLSTGSTSAIPLFKRFLADCSNDFYQQIAFKYYDRYKELERRPDKKLNIEDLEGSLFEELQKYKGSLLFLDFWASWCSPCIENLPFVKKLGEKYKDEDFKVIYINIDDNIGSAESLANKMGLSGTVLYLDKEQSKEIRKLLDIGGIPHYLLVDKNGEFVEMSEPDPRSLETRRKIEELLDK